MKKWISCLVGTIRQGIWFPVLIFIIHSICAHFFGNLYDLYPPLDIPMHFFGGVAIAYFSAVFLKQCEINDLITIKSAVLSTILILALTVSAATLWEYAEWTLDHIFHTQAQKGLDDTLLDTLMGLFGGILFVVISHGKQILKELFEK